MTSIGVLFNQTKCYYLNRIHANSDSSILFTGVAVSADNVLYFADGTNIRMVDRDGIVTTVIGNHIHKSHWKPIPCEGTLHIQEVCKFISFLL